MKFSTAVAVAGLVASANAHATFQKFWTNASTSTTTCVRQPLNNSPLGTLDANLACNNNGDVAASAKCTVAAGSSVAMEMHQQPGETGCASDAIGGNHDGPVIIYMAKVSDSKTATGGSANWFKVAQSGLISAVGTTYTWATDVMNTNCGKVSFTIPSCLPAGDYLVRAEVIALHVAGSSGGAQHYASCAQVTVTGGGSASPSTVKIPGAYSLTDPGILFDMYGVYTQYTIPGPPVFSCSGTGTTTTRATTSASPTTTSTQPAQTAYGQCGGTGWTGPTTCVSGYKCNAQSQYYSQCIPI